MLLTFYIVKVLICTYRRLISLCFQLRTCSTQLEKGNGKIGLWIEICESNLIRIWKKTDTIRLKAWDKKKNLENERVYKFLTGLNRHLDDVRGKILSQRPLPLSREAFSEVCYKEKRGKVMLKVGRDGLEEENFGSVLISKGIGPTRSAQELGTLFRLEKKISPLLEDYHSWFPVWTINSGSKDCNYLSESSRINFHILSYFL